jgi:hypothetical protein
MALITSERIRGVMKARNVSAFVATKGEGRAPLFAKGNSREREKMKLENKNCDHH